MNWTHEIDAERSETGFQAHIVLRSRGYVPKATRKIFLLLRAVNANCATHLRFPRPSESGYLKIQPESH